ncbi:MAG: hypothetical protein ABWW70_02805 [Thermoproteota archaeon]
MARRQAKVCAERPGVDLDASMYPSFVSSIYAYVGRSSWIKAVGVREAWLLRKEGDRICCYGCPEGEIMYLSGLWCGDACSVGAGWEHGWNLLPKELRSLASRIIVVSSRADELVVASAAFLSRRTGYASNVVRWVRFIFKEGVSEDSVRRRALMLRSYQPRQLASVYGRLAEALKAGRSAWDKRFELLQVPYVGPKTADAVLLFTGYTSSVAPADTHLEKLARSMRIRRYLKPSKDVCLKYGPDCTSCRLSDECLSGIFVGMYDAGAGLIQTAAYIWGSLGRRLQTRLTQVLKRYFSQRL